MTQNSSELGTGCEQMQAPRLAYALGCLFVLLLPRLWLTLFGVVCRSHRLFMHNPGAALLVAGITIPNKGQSVQDTHYIRK